MTTIQSTPQSVLDAMAEVHDESDRWRLAEALHGAIPKGVDGFQQIVDDAKNAGIPALSVNTLRLYRDTASRWPEARRVAHVTFSAHREAMVLGSTTEARHLLEGMAKQHGADKVTVSAVRRAIAAQTGKPLAKSAAKPAAESDVNLADLMRGGERLIAVIRGAAPGLQEAQLDQIHKGLTAALVEVEKLRAKKSRGRKTAKATTPAKPRVTTPAKTTRKPEVAGDLRGL